MDQKNSFGISRKLILGFIVPILLATVMGISFIVTNQISAGAQHDLNTAVEILDTARQMNVEMLNARRREKDFLLFNQEDGFNEAYNNYVLANQTHTQNVRDLLNQLANLNEEQGDNAALTQADLNAAREVTVTYDTLFAEVVTGIETRGFVDTGLEGNLRTIASQLEDEFEGMNDEHLMTAYLTVRRREKDYFLRADPIYVTETQAALGELKTEVMASEALSESKKRQLSQLIDDYSVAFASLVAIDGEISTSLALLREKRARA